MDDSAGMTISRGDNRLIHPCGIACFGVALKKCVPHSPILCFLALVTTSRLTLGICASFSNSCFFLNTRSQFDMDIPCSYTRVVAWSSPLPSSKSAKSSKCHGIPPFILIFAGLKNWISRGLRSDFPPLSLSLPFLQRPINKERDIGTTGDFFLAEFTYDFRYVYSG